MTSGVSPAGGTPPTPPPGGRKPPPPPPPPPGGGGGGGDDNIEIGPAARAVVQALEIAERFVGLCESNEWVNRAVKDSTVVRGDRGDRGRTDARQGRPG